MTRDATASLLTASLLTAARTLIAPTLRKRWLRLIPLGVTVALLESAGMLLVFGLLALIATPPDAPLPTLLAPLRDAAHAQLPGAWFITGYATFVGAFFVAKNALRLWETRVRQHCVRDTTLALSDTLLQAYFAAPFTEVQARGSAALIRNLRDGVSAAQIFLATAAAACTETLVILCVAGMLLLSTPLAALLAAAMAGLSALGVMRWMQYRFALLGAQRHELHESLTRSAAELFAGQREIRAAGHVTHFARRDRRLRERAGDVHVAAETLRAVPMIAIETLFVVALVAAATFMLSRPGDAAEQPLVALGYVGYALMRLLPTLHLLIYHLNEVRFRSAAVRELAADLAAFRAAARNVPDAHAAPAAFTREIAFDAVTYTYPGAAQPALREVSLTLRRGECVGLVGPSGAGKSTLVDLLLGLITAERGQITVDGQSLSTLGGAWSRAIGYVAQSPFFVDDTVRRNIAFGEEDERIDEARLAAAVRSAQLESVIAALPEGLDTPLGERAERLSGGERQRLATARALYREPLLLVFDEPTSALDAATDRNWSAAIDSLRGDRTVLIIAHRMETLRHCDRLLLLEGGRILDSGSIDELRQRQPQFRALEASLSAAGS